MAGLQHRVSICKEERAATSIATLCNPSKRDPDHDYGRSELNMTFPFACGNCGHHHTGQRSRNGSFCVDCSQSMGGWLSDPRDWTV